MKDLFGYGEDEPTGTALVKAEAPKVVSKEHSSTSMSMSEFAGWIEANIGSNVTDALEQAAFLLCCDVITQDISKATLQLCEVLPNGTTRVVAPKEHPIAALLALEPNARHTWIEYVEMAVYWLCLTSNSFALVKRNPAGDPIALVPLQTGRVLELVNERELFYRVTASTLQEQALLGASVVDVPERDMIHVRARMLDGLDGYSTLVAGKKTLSAGKALENLRESIFSEDGQQRGVFTRPGTGPDDVSTDVAFQRLRQQYKELMSRYRRTLEPIVLEGGLEFKAISSSPKDIELAQQFTQQINATCRLLRVPPHKVFNLDNSKYDNLETQEKDYVSSTLIPVCTRFEQRYSKLLLSSRDRLKYVFRHNREQMMLKDTKAETERAVRALERTAITFDEFRSVIGLNPLPEGGGHRYLPVNATIIDENEEVVVAATAPPTTNGDQNVSDAASTDSNQPTDGSQKGLRLVK